MKDTDLSIIIVNWNTKELLKDCLTSLYRQDMVIGNEVIIVDNHSTDGSLQMVAEEFPMVRLISNNSNEGFARANNKALKEVKGRYALLLNSDTIVPYTGIFGKWISFMDENPDAGASGCRLVQKNGKHWVGDAGYKPDLASIINYSFFLSKLKPEFFKGVYLTYNNMHLPLKVDWISGAAFLVRSSILPHTGLLSEDTFMYAEDVEWGCRISSSGYLIYYLPCIEIIHLVGGSGKRNDHLSGYSVSWLKNLRLLYREYNKKQPAAVFNIIFGTGLILRLFLYCLLYLKNRKKEDIEKAKQLVFYAKYLFKNQKVSYAHRN